MLQSGLGHGETGKPANNWNLNALAGAGTIRSTANDMLRALKADMGIDQSLAAAMKRAQQPRSDRAKTMRIGLAWITTYNPLAQRYDRRLQKLCRDEIRIPPMNQ